MHEERRFAQDWYHHSSSRCTGAVKILIHFLHPQGKKNHREVNITSVLSSLFTSRHSPLTHQDLPLRRCKSSSHTSPSPRLQLQNLGTKRCTATSPKRHNSTSPHFLIPAAYARHASKSAGQENFGQDKEEKKKYLYRSYTPDVLNGCLRVNSYANASSSGETPNKYASWKAGKSGEKGGLSVSMDLDALQWRPFISAESRLPLIEDRAMYIKGDHLRPSPRA